MHITHVVVVRYVNEYQLETAVSFFASSEDNARALARTLEGVKPRRSLFMVATRPPYTGTLQEYQIIGDVVWSRL
jgi:hypothetical protein